MAIDWGKTADVAQVLEAIIVAISVIFIWFQLRQQTKLSKVANAQALFELTAPFNMEVIKERNMAQLIFEGHKHYDSFDEVDKFRYRGALTWRLTFQELMYYQNQKGLLDSSIYHAWEDDFKAFIDRRQLKLRWSELEQYYNPEFRGYVSKTIEALDSASTQQLIRPDQR